MKIKFHRADGKLGPFAARRLSLRDRHRMLTASIVALSSLIVPLAVVEPAWPKEIEQARSQPKPSTCDRSQFRVVLDVGNWDNSRAVNHPGQSGDPESPHYRDLFALWSKDKFFPVPYSRPEVAKEAESRQVLVPR